MTWIEMIKAWLKDNKPKRCKSMDIDIKDVGQSITAKRSAKGGSGDNSD